MDSYAGVQRAAESNFWAVLREVYPDDTPVELIRRGLGIRAAYGRWQFQRLVFRAHWVRVTQDWL